MMRNEEGGGGLEKQREVIDCMYIRISIDYHHHLAAMQC